LGGLTAKAHFKPATAGEVKIDLVLSGASTAEGIAEIEKQANLEVSYQEDGIHFAPRSFSWTSSDGKVIQAKFIKLEGDFVTLEVGGQQHKFPLARLSPESRAPAVTAEDLDSQVLAVQPDGKKILTGWFSSVLGVPRSHIARIHADGSLDMASIPMPMPPR
jgi:hypothetical protein